MDFVHRLRIKPIAFSTMLLAKFVAWQESPWGPSICYVNTSFPLIKNRCKEIIIHFFSWFLWKNSYLVLSKKTPQIKKQLRKFSVMFTTENEIIRSSWRQIYRLSDSYSTSKLPYEPQFCEIYSCNSDVTLTPHVGRWG